MIDKAGFDLKAIPRVREAEFQEALAAYLAVFRVLTGASERSISLEAVGSVSFLCNWRRGVPNNNLTFERYEKLVAYMDEKLIEFSGVPFERLGRWINARLRRLSQEEFEAAQTKGRKTTGARH